MGILLTEHREIDLLRELGIDPLNFNNTSLVPQRTFPSKKGVKYCYSVSEKQNSYFINANYFIGVDWIIKKERYIQVKPKLNIKLFNEFEKKIDTEEESQPDDLNSPPVYDENKDFKELNYLKLLMDAFKHPVIASQTNNLVLIDWEAEQIQIKQEDDALTPFLVVQFLNLLKQIVKKGLKKSYYKVQENLNNRIKGKILVGANIKQNVLKNRLTKTYCEYQQFGIDYQENRFLKKVLYYCSNYVHQNAGLFQGNEKNLEQLINYCKPAFELVSDETEITTLKNIKHNPFFKEYKEAIKIGQYILKRFAYNISNTAKSKKIETPPFWIDMPQLFELYVYHHLLTVFNESEINFQFATYGNVLDFLISKEGSEMVIDAKYKMHYRSSHIHEDIRQVAGYARLNKVYDKLKSTKTKTDIIDCLIIYPSAGDIKEQPKFNFEDELKAKKEIKTYNRVYKIGIPMPYIEN